MEKYCLNKLSNYMNGVMRLDKADYLFILMTASLLLKKWKQHLTGTYQVKMPFLIFLQNLKHLGVLYSIR